MAGCKKKEIRQKETPGARNPIVQINADAYYQKHPSWVFRIADEEMWPFTREHIGGFFWESVLPRMKALETMTWNEILLENKKHNHSISCDRISVLAQRRLAERHIEMEAIVSLKVDGTHRIYGYIVGAAFHILWYDDDHGDNDTCVCRSTKKHT